MASVLLWFMLRRRWRRLEKDNLDVSLDADFEKGRGPKKFTSRELVNATGNFREEGKLGQGGFGAVYKGFLIQDGREVAVKRAEGSKQGKKEYISEVKIISRLRHRNLVQLVGWCHRRGDFLLVYEFMPNGSLDTHLYKKTTLLAWPERYKISLGLASALLYLHEQCEQCVVHRDIKPSNVMLDSSFNAKLGDFGLARLVDHDSVSQSTKILAGTNGYMSPEYAYNFRAGKECDVYSFGVVALEISCGRRPVEHKEEPGKVMLVESVWDLYGRGKILEAADKRLENEFDEEQMERLMVVGLWCAHPNYKLRPSIQQAINVLIFVAPMPVLPSEMPKLMFSGSPPQLDVSYNSAEGSAFSLTMPR
ncbi:hypothetical protein J5N97_011237 [Dioscorea zingiberensis]|uniref:Protein kinase domain-containing protein n=1 Tax=Dioscorea zingiberensis TaxID=325984 RepID=A0A9D5HPD2_9LILI|nr:hypothetical protein J5N97_011237 [Dioscorea zingiberensis]